MALSTPNVNELADQLDSIEEKLARVKDYL
jgi:hypothetical protein